MTTEHHQSPSIAFSRINCPLIEQYRKTAEPQYRPAQLVTAVVKDQLVLEAQWPAGKGNIVGCSPIRAKIEVPLKDGNVDFDNAHATVTKEDVFGDEPTQLPTDMVNGLLESADEHAHPEHQWSGSSLSSLQNGIAVSRYALRRGVADAIGSHIDTREILSSRDVAPSHNVPGECIESEIAVPLPAARHLITL